MPPRVFVKKPLVLETRKPPSSSIHAADTAVPEVDVEVVEEEIEETHLDTPWRVILYNDDIHTFDEVVLQLMKATGCSLSRARSLTFEAHTNGKAAVYEGTMDACLRVQGILREIQLVTEIQG